MALSSAFCFLCLEFSFILLSVFYIIIYALGVRAGGLRKNFKKLFKNLLTT